MNDTEEWSYWVHVVCTDRGTHASRALAHAELNNDPEMWAIWRSAATSPEDREATETLILHESLGQSESRLPAPYSSRRAIDAVPSQASPGTFIVNRRDSGRGSVKQKSPARTFPNGIGSGVWRFICPTCKRDVQMKDARMRDTILTLKAAGQEHLDISLVS